MTTLAEIEAIGAKEAVSTLGCLPNEWEPEGDLAERWSKIHVNEVEACRAFLRSASLKMLPKRTWSCCDSYQLKHDLQRVSGLYVCNGSFIIAAMLEGLAVKRHGINAKFRRALDGNRKGKSPCQAKQPQILAS